MTQFSEAFNTYESVHTKMESNWIQQNTQMKTRQRARLLSSQSQRKVCMLIVN